MNVLTLPSARAVPPWIGKWVRDNLATGRSQLLLVGLALTLTAGGLTVLDSLDTKMRRTIADPGGRAALGGGDRRTCSSKFPSLAHRASKSGRYRPNRDPHQHQLKCEQSAKTAPAHCTGNRPVRSS